MQFAGVAVGVLDQFHAAHDADAAQPHLAARHQAMEALGRHFGEILALDPQLRRERHLARAHRLVLGMVGEAQRLLVPGRQVGDHQPQRVEHGHAPRRMRVQFLAHAALEHAELDHAVLLGHAEALAEGPDRGGGEAAAAHRRKRGHARIVPAVDQAVGDQRHQLALAHHGVVEVQARELDLLRRRHRHRQAARAQRRGQLGVAGQVELAQEPVVQRPMVLELQRAQRMGDALDRVGNAVRVVVHRVDAPGVAGHLVPDLADAVDRRVAQVDVAAGHVDLRAQGARAIGELAGAHAPQQFEALGHRALAPRRVAARLGQGAAVFAHLLGAEVADEGRALAHQLLGAQVEGLEVVRGVQQHVPLEAEPAHVLLDRAHVLEVLLDRIGVVEAQVADAAELGRHAEIEADALGVADVQVAVGLGREARGDAAAVAAGGAVLDHDLADEVVRRFARCCGLGTHGPVAGAGSGAANRGV